MKEENTGPGRQRIRTLHAPVLAILFLAFCLGIICSASSACAAGTDPDLSISPSDVTLSFNTPNEGDTVIIYAQIGVNYSGAQDAVVVEVLLDGNIEFLADAPIGPDRYSTAVSFDWVAKSGTHTLTLVLDPHEDIPETNDENNQASMTISVKRIPQSPAQSDWSPLACGAFVVITLVLIAALMYTSWKKDGREQTESEKDDERPIPEADDKKSDDDKKGDAPSKEDESDAGSPEGKD